MLVVLSHLLLASATVQAGSNDPIVVTGQRIRDLKGNLAECIRRNCPPDKEIDAALGLAEAQLMSGDYRDARRTLVKTLSRNKDEAARYPIPVSDLYRANGKVSAHLGEDKDFYRSTWGIYRTLKLGLPSAEERKFSSLMEVAEMVYRTRGHERARLYYDSIAKQAREAGRPDIAALAELRSAIRHLPPGSPWQLREIKRVANLRGEEMQAPKLEATLALARMAYERNDETGAQKALNNLAELNIRRPILIYVPPFDVIGGQAGRGEMSDIPHSHGEMLAGGGAGGSKGGGIGGKRDHGTRAFASNHMGINVEDMWMDVSFRITSDGRVADAKIVKSRGDLFWTGPLMASIKSRRYTPGKEGDPMSYRIERYTYTSGKEFGAASRTATHSPKARVEYFDLTPDGGGISSPDT